MRRHERSLFDQNRKRIEASLEHRSRELERYEARYRRSLRARGRVLGFDGLLTRMLKARVTLVGDDHTLPEAQATFHRLLSLLPRCAESPFIVALEMLPGDRPELISRFLRGEVDEATFLHRIDHARRWPFAALDRLRPIFALCRRRNWTLIGLDPHPDPMRGVEARDDYAAAKIAAALKAQPAARAVALMGEFHLAPSHLPRALARRLGTPVFRVHQNPERLWFETRDRLLHLQEVVELDTDAAAVLSASPVYSQASFLAWIEQVQDGPVDAHALDESTRQHGFECATELLVRALAVPRERLFEVDVHGPRDVSFLSRLRGKERTSVDVQRLKNRVLAGVTSYIPELRAAFLGSTSLEDAAEAAQGFVRHAWSAEGRVRPKNNGDQLAATALRVAGSVVGRRIIQPRKAPALASNASRTVRFGHDFGERLFTALEQGRLACEDIEPLFSAALGPDGEARRLLALLERRCLSAASARRARDT